MLIPNLFAPDRRLLLLAGLTASSSAIAMAGTAEAASSEAGLTVIAEIVAKPEHAADVRSALAPFATRTKSEPGCLH